MGSEVNVFLKCLSCSTFITSPSFSVIRKHFYKCQLNKGENSSAVNPVEDDSDCDDFIDEEMESVTFTQPYLVLKRSTLEHSNFPKLNTPNGLQSEDSLNDDYDDEDWDLGAEDSDDETWGKKRKQLKRIKANIGKKKVKDSGQIITTQGKKRRQKCEKCSKLIDPRYLSNHMKRSHSNTVPADQGDTFKCAYPDCEIKCKSVQLLKCHFIYHLEKNPYVCYFPGCKVKCDAASHLMRHIRLQHLEPLISCPKCKVSYASRNNMKLHDCDLNLKKQKSGSYKLIQDKDSGWRLKRVLETGGLQKCKKPRKGSYVAPNGSVSTSTHSKDKIQEYIKSLKRIDINAIIRSDPGFIQACKDSPGFSELLLGDRPNLNFANRQSKQKSYKCAKCPTVFEGRHGYVEHEKHCAGGNPGQKVSPDKPQIGCPACGKPFLGTDLLEKHLTEEHSPDEIFKCEEANCGRYFSSDVSKDRHFRLCHIKREYQCRKCRGRYKTEAAYLKHVRQHRADPNFGWGKAPPCKACGQVLTGAHSLRRHMQLKHGIIVEAPVKKVKQKRKQIKRKPVLHSAELEKFKFNGEISVQVKVEPELHILPYAVISNDNHDFHDFDQIVKTETD